jgi:hypothetical protein
VRGRGDALHACKCTSASDAASSHHGTKNSCPVSVLAPAARYKVKFGAS